MAAQLIPVFNGSISKESTLLVNTRDLHTFLEIGKRFASWVTERITEYGFVENQDYILVSQHREIKGRGGDRRSKDYHLTLDTAKELAMVERNEKGRQIRRYFIECEKELQARPSKSVTLAAPGRYRLLQTVEANQVIDVELVSPGKFLATRQEHSEALQWCGYVVARPEDLIKLTAVELTEHIQRCLKRRKEWLATIPSISKA